MGLGRYRDGKFDLIVVANYLLTADDWTAWERSLKKASEILYNASEGQMQFGRLFVCDENIGASIAEIMLHQSEGLSYGLFRGFGMAGMALHLMAPIKRDPLVTLHELGHHVWGLGEEYMSSMVSDLLDITSPIRDYRIIPVVDRGLSIDWLVERQARAILQFFRAGDIIFEERLVVANTATTVTVDADYSDYTTNASEVWYSFPAACADDPGANYCIMEACHRERGYFDEAGLWHDLPTPLTEFCTPGNHDLDGDTQQDQWYDKSCWEVILDQPDFAGLTMPDPAGSGPTEGWTEPDWIVLDKQPRLALVLDRSGSMAGGHKMADAQYGAEYWLRNCVARNDLLTIIWYDHEITSILDLTDVALLPDLETEIDEIYALEPRGTTNIREALFAALDQVQSRATRAAVQVALLLTDGKHNTPWGSHANEVIPDYQEGGVRIYSLGVGEAALVDMDVLDELAAATGGSSYAVGDDNPIEVERAMIEIHTEVRGGIITTIPAYFPLVIRSPLGAGARPWQPAPAPKERVSFQELLHILKIKTIKQVIHPSKKNRRCLTAIPVEVEPQCRRASFTLVYPQGRDLWLYLIDPDGNPVDMGAAGVYHCISDAPHEFALVENPQAGRWYMVAVRPHASAGFSFRAIAGGENPHLQVFGGASTNNPLQTPVRLWAMARWGHDLTNLQVSATFTTPLGYRQRLLMTDCRGDERDSGVFEAFYTPSQPGRYRGTIEISNQGNARQARSRHLVAHMTENRVTLKSVPTRFVRQVPFYFDVGPRPEVKDVEQARSLTQKYPGLRPRPTKLESAGTKVGQKKPRR
jgi:hypothetical protein